MREPSTSLLVVASGTLGDVLPVARVVDRIAPHVHTQVVTNQSYERLFPTSGQVIPLPFDPTRVIASRAGQRMIEGGRLGARRLAGLYGVVHPQIRPSVHAVAVHVARASHLLVSGIPFGVSQLGSIYAKPVLRLLYQPHWPNWEIKSLYANTGAQWSRPLNRASHLVAEGVAQAMFRSELRAALIESTRCRDVADEGRLRRLLHESFYSRHETLLSLTEAFGHRVLRDAPWARFTGFIRPASIDASEEFLAAVRGLERERRPLVYCGFGSMVSARTRRIMRAVVAAAEALGLVVVVQGQANMRSTAVRNVPFGDHRVLFPRCDALIHHGGAGTVVASLDAGRPFAVVPQWADQFYWAERTAQLNLAVPHRGAPDETTAWKATLEQLLRHGAGGGYAERAAATVGEDGLERAVASLEAFLET